MKRMINGASIWTQLPWQVFAVMAVTMPTLGVIAARQMLSNRGPQAAQASIITPAGEQAIANLTRAVPGRRTAAQIATIRTLEDIASRPFATSPLAQPREQSEAVESSAVPADIRFTGLLTSILETPNGSVALIGGKMRRVGDLLGNTWQLTSLSPDEGTATITHGSGVKQVLVMRRGLEARDK